MLNDLRLHFFKKIKNKKPRLGGVTWHGLCQPYMYTGKSGFSHTSSQLYGELDRSHGATLHLTLDLESRAKVIAASRPSWLGANQRTNSSRPVADLTSTKYFALTLITEKRISESQEKSTINLTFFFFLIRVWTAPMWGVQLRGLLSILSSALDVAAHHQKIWHYLS